MEIGQTPPLCAGLVEVGARVAVGSGVGVSVGVDVLVGEGVHVAVAVAVGVEVGGANNGELHPVNERINRNRNTNFKTVFMVSSD